MKDYFENPKKVRKLGMGLMGLNLLSEEEIKDLLGEEGESLLEANAIVESKR
ncbi:hypothetical protein [uncultured Microscilla sp.]|uniref:Uncharacterized protein n=2 Tax=Microscilla marina TaxID=1027 RepID=A1ZQ77_MICM2|nr:hypothetical protein [uncultured Microscilla sp.]EAY27486.1 hypothetical protein M23134_06887 [Microscilla marina ATCC 23134]